MKLGELMAKVTIKDVAKEAGVSISTVSNALNNVDVLNPQTKKHVLEVAERMNYIPDLRGKNLKAKNTKMIGFFTTSVGGSYFHNLVESMSNECDRHGYGLNIFFSKDKNVILNNILGGSVDAAIIFSYEYIKEKEIELINNQNIKTVFFDREVHNKNMGSILFDSYNSGYEATSYLLNLGHKKIVYISGRGSTYDSEERKKGCLTALKEYGVEPKSEYIIRGFYEKEAGYNAVRSFINQHPREIPDAFLAGNDLSAIGAIEALEAEGLRVPKDISVMGFDDIEIAQYYNPKLTTVRNQISRQGILAVQHAIELINNESEGKVYKLPGKIIGRDSTSIRTGIQR